MAQRHDVLAAGIVEAHANLKRGPLNGLFNYTRRPLPAVTLSVVEPVSAEVKAELTEMEIAPGTPARVMAGLKNVPADSRVEVRGLPASIAWHEIQRTASAVEFEHVPSTDTAVRTVSFTVEVNALGRWTSSRRVRLKIAMAPAEWSALSRAER